MARKTKEEAEKTRVGILDATLEIIYEKGYSATNLNDIATRLGMTRGAVYWHFKNKEDLFYSLNKEFEKELDQILEKKINQVKSLSDLKALLLYIGKLHVSNERLFKYMTTLSVKIEWNDELKRVVRLFKKQSQEMESYCLYILKNAEKNGDLQPGIDKKTTAKSLTALMDGCLLSILPPFGKRNTDVIENTLDIFFQGLTAQ